ncbi:MAG: aminotransferase class I/II-fold pyridoxal phosphate-dependent enzyme [Candidatus Lokiarchaeota archaeon]|nr:aminotransferase class I/II-fold pyridoxal phosphate-dependent enzyme [Candidatus Lokiarchaeota archaeon]
MKLEYSKRVKRLPTYIFVEIEQLLSEKRKEGIDLIPLGIGDPDIATPDLIINELIKQVKKPENQKYPTSMGEEDFREVVARWYKIRFNINLDPKEEISNVIGGKEGVANIARAFVNPGDIVLCPNPGYPVYENGATKLCDADPYSMPLLKEINFLPDLDAIDTKILKKAKLMYLNYPNNPTGAIAPKEFLKKVVDYAQDYNFFIVHDNPYSEFTFDDYIAPSILQIDQNHVEINSASKMFNMTGFRCGWVAGNKDIIQGLRKIKSQIDSGCPKFIQRAVIKGLNEYKSQKKPEIIERTVKTYEKRRDILIKGLNDIGWTTNKPQATFYVWTQIPEKYRDNSCMEFVKDLIEVGVVITPGTGFGQYGEGFVRFALTQPEQHIIEAIERIDTLIN